jgi:hypothetical protein
LGDLRLEIENTRLVWWQHNLDRKQITILGVTELIWHLLDESTNHRMHDSMFSVSFLPVAVELVARQHRPMLFVSVRLGLEEALPLVDLFFVLLLLSKPLNNRVAIGW